MFLESLLVLASKHFISAVGGWQNTLFLSGGPQQVLADRHGKHAWRELFSLLGCLRRTSALL